MCVLLISKKLIGGDEYSDIQLDHSPILHFVQIRANIVFKDSPLERDNRAPITAYTISSAFSYPPPPSYDGRFHSRKASSWRTQQH